MRAVTIVDGDLRWLEHPDPVPGDTELVVAVRAAGINSADLLQRLGFYPAPPGSPPDIPGMELAGEVVGRRARASRFAVGDRVMAVVGGGAQAELAVVDERCALAVPDGRAVARGGRISRGVLHRLRRPLHPVRAGHGRTGARHRRRRRGGERRGAAGGGHRGPLVASVRHARLRDAVAALGATRRRSRRGAGPRPVRRGPRARGRGRASPACSDAMAIGGTDRR